MARLTAAKIITGNEKPTRVFELRKAIASERKKSMSTQPARRCFPARAINTYADRKARAGM